MFLDTLEERTFHYFWDLSNASSGLTPDRWPTPSFSSIAAVGFALTSYPIGVERGYVSRQAAAGRALLTLRFFLALPQDSAPGATSGYRGFFYHFLDMSTGRRFGTVELSTIDSGLLLAGALACQSYFDGGDSTESGIRAAAESLYARADWRWAQARPPLVAMGWLPESGFLASDWRGYNEAMLVYILALGAPSHAVDSTAWPAWTSTYAYGDFEGQGSHVGFAPLFGHQYSHVWIDFSGIRDAYMQGKGSDYFENSRRATRAQLAYATANPSGFTGYGANLWGLSASDGPADVQLTVAGRPRQFHTYFARGASFTEIQDDGTLAPTALGGSVPFAPEITIPALVAMRRAYGDNLFSTYGFLDALNPTFPASATPTMGHNVSGLGWFDTDYLGIDQGAILAMVENYRSGLIWRLMRGNAHIVRGLCRAGFTGGWLAGRCA